MNVEEYALVGGEVWDSAAGRLRSGLTVHVAAGRIVAVCPPEQAAADVRAIDVAGCAIMPGLIDAHVHSEEWHASLRPVGRGQRNHDGAGHRLRARRDPRPPRAGMLPVFPRRGWSAAGR